MEIILREDVQHLGKVGEVVKVKDGYARNYLLPKGLAYPATEANKKKIAYEGERIAKQRASEKSTAETEATRLAGVRSEEHTSELQSLAYLVCRLLLEKKKKKQNKQTTVTEVP